MGSSVCPLARVRREILAFVAVCSMCSHLLRLPLRRKKQLPGMRQLRQLRAGLWLAIEGKEDDRPVLFWIAEQGG